MVDVYVQKRRDGEAAKRFFKRLLKSNGGNPRTIVTDKLASYGVAQRELMSEAGHDTSQYANNRAERSHEKTRFRERGMRRFKSLVQAQSFLDHHSVVSNFFNLGKDLVNAEYYLHNKEGAFSTWAEVTA